MGLSRQTRDMLERAAQQRYAQASFTVGRQGHRTDASGYVSQTFTVPEGLPSNFSDAVVPVWRPRKSAAEDLGECLPDLDMDDDPDCWYYPGPEEPHSGHW